MSKVEKIRVEVAYVDAGCQFLHELTLGQGATVADAIDQSGVRAECGLQGNLLDVGIWSKPVSIDTVLADGDRVEIYRPLQADPKQARRARVKRKT